MIKLEHTVLASPEQMEFIIEGMRNPMNSWEKSDSSCGKVTRVTNVQWSDDYFIGTNDANLMQRLSKAGTDHRKFMRMMPVYVRITAPLYWWKEFDTYQVGVCPNPTDIIKNSCSTMHKIQEKEFTLDDFSCEHLNNDTECWRTDCDDPYENYGLGAKDILQATIDSLNKFRDLYINGVHNGGCLKIRQDKDIWWQMIQLLPSSYNQTRNVMMNYEVLANIYKSRKNHKLDEWREFCKWIEELPYSELIIGIDNEGEEK